MLSRSDALMTGLFACVATSALVFAGIGVGVETLKSPLRPGASSPLAFEQALSNWDGVWYGTIVRRGYSYSAEAKSNVAFFPAYPALGYLVHKATGLSPEMALAGTSLASLAVAFALFAWYAAERLEDPRTAEIAVMALGLWPTTFFFRVAYSEALFLALALTAMLGMQRRWPMAGIAGTIALATATRSVGVALLPVFALFLWEQRTDRSAFLRTAAWALPLSVLGLTAFMAFQYAQFGDALAFAKVQAHWSVRPPASPLEHLTALVTLEPFWSVYCPDSPAYWASHDPYQGPLTSLRFANPLFVAAAGGLTTLGAAKHWLNARETLLSAGLLLIPYVTHSYQTGMMSEGRFASLAFPVYLVLGRLGARSPMALLLFVAALSGAWLVAYAALFAAYFPMI